MLQPEGVKTSVIQLDRIKPCFTAVYDVHGLLTNIRDLRMIHTMNKCQFKINKCQIWIIYIHLYIYAKPVSFFDHDM